MQSTTRRKAAWSGVYWIGALLALVIAHHAWSVANEPRTVPISELKSLVSSDKVARAEVRMTEIVAELRDGGIVRAKRVPNVDETALVTELDKRGIAYRGVPESASWWGPLLLGWMLPLALMAALWWFSMRRMSRHGPLVFGRAKVHDRAKTERATFADIAGVDEAVAELREVVDFLAHPERYRALGARIPKGVLLAGPPGTGKTLLARAIAGEAGVPFFSISASEFVEMFVGVGAARARDLFEQAKAHAPCIVFIDEIDAIGKARGGIGAVATHDEREQTLNQLLVEMDGFDGSHGVVIIAATNRPEVLDPALRRAGRFDRMITIDRPDLAGREAILRVHARRVPLGAVDLRTIARRTAGMVGADLANVVNEAALAAARRQAQTVDMGDFEAAIDRIQLGLERRRVMTDADKRRVAVHEAGHAIVALSVEHADPVHRVTIVPRSIGALGATLQVPEHERHLMTRAQLVDRIAVLLGGRIAEELVLDDISNGAQNDLEHATELARDMVCRFGMSERLGPVTYRANPYALGDSRSYGESTATLIDAEIRGLVERQQVRVRQLLETQRAALEMLVERLLEAETLDRDEVLAIWQAARVAPETSPSERPRAAVAHAH